MNFLYFDLSASTVQIGTNPQTAQAATLVFLFSFKGISTTLSVKKAFTPLYCTIFAL